MTRRSLVVLAFAVLVLGGCAVPRWVPFIGKDGPPARSSQTDARPDRRRAAKASNAPADEASAKREVRVDERVTDRVVAVVNNDAITWGELLESILAYRQDGRQASATASDEELARQFLPRLIDSRLQLQEADREKVSVEDVELTEELADLAKKVGAPSVEVFEEMARGQGLSVETLRKRTRERIRVSKILRRKVGMRVSVTETEIDRYLEANRQKLETGLSYHARHILIVPDGDDASAFARAHERATAVRNELLAGADFATVAAKVSADTKDGGDLGTLKRGELAPDIEAQILTLEPGDTSEPYRSSLGWHVFRLETKQTLQGDALARVRQQIREILFREKYEARLDAWLKELKQRAVIEVRL